MHQSGRGQLVITLNIETTQQHASGDDKRRRRQKDTNRHVHLIPVPDRVLITSHHETPVHINCITIKGQDQGQRERGVNGYLCEYNSVLVWSPLRL